MPLRVRAMYAERASAVQARRLRSWKRSEEHTAELQSRENLVCRLLVDLHAVGTSILSLHDALPICPWLPSPTWLLCSPAWQATREGPDRTSPSPASRSSRTPCH